MRHEFVTLFDANYLPRGIVLYRSLTQHAPDFRLRVVCLDETTRDVLAHLDLPNLETIPLSDLEQAHPELGAVKPTRSRTEYAWTMTPATCLYSLEREPNLQMITYIDSDLMFFGDPAPIFDEFGSDSLLITPHRYAPAWSSLEPLSGRFNVQFMTFRNDARGLSALTWWHERCIEWCYQRHEPGKFGDQKYLDDWPERFDGVHVLDHPGGGLAPWNVSQYRLSIKDTVVRVDDRPLIFFHFHGLRPYRTMFGRVAWRSDYPTSRSERQLLWRPYMRELKRGVDTAQALEPAATLGVAPFSLRSGARRLARRVIPGAARRRARRALAARPSRSTWKSRSVAAQHRDLVLDQLRHPENVAPFRAFSEAVEALLSKGPVLPAPAQFLDFGCGAGHYGELLAERFPHRFEYTGYDFSPGMVEVASGLWPNRTFAVKDLFDEHLDLSGFDVICAGAMIDVLPDYNRALDILFGADAVHVLLHRQRVTSGPSRVDRVDSYKGLRTFAVFLSIRDLEAIAERHSRTVLHSVHVDAEIYSFVLSRSA